MPYRLALLLFPVAELIGLIVAGGAIGALPTFGLLLLGTVVGAVLLRQQGAATLTRIRADLDARRVPGAAVAEGAITAAAALLLIFPGFISDILALLLLVPPLRQRLLGLAGRRFKVHSAPQPGRRGHPATLDLPAGEFTVSAPDARRPPAAERRGG